MIIRSTIEGSNRVFRGGSWNNNAKNCRVSNRNNNNPGNSNNNNGFRLVLAPAHRHGRMAATEQMIDLPLSFLGQKTNQISPTGNENECRADFQLFNG
ncbi:MAG: SUMF1/EgtB/PvdO family nonheme iron enzyme [Mangrovibacterium sp.]